MDPSMPAVALYVCTTTRETDLIGLLLFLLLCSTVIGQSSAAVGDTRGAIRWRNASYGISIAGIIVGIIIVVVCVKAARISYNQNSPAARKFYYQYSSAIGKSYNQYSSTTRQSYYQYSSATRTSYYLQYKRCFDNYLRVYYLCINWWPINWISVSFYNLLKVVSFLHGSFNGITFDLFPI